MVRLHVEERAVREAAAGAGGGAAGLEVAAGDRVVIRLGAHGARVVGPLVCKAHNTESDLLLRGLEVAAGDGVVVGLGPHGRAVVGPLVGGGVDVGDVLGAGGAVVHLVVVDAGVAAREGEHGGVADDLQSILTDLMDNGTPGTQYIANV
eukprot:CAMPEP_0173378200 /NCGR_PEP_ID=MMETSP1356-20130122/1374_1 /TAXON_ID=77927 ORGANISM="Hemiselmis virescens, Strain PCC157" /NCGR_SAMPLE_ID=MMETSP1356 /ASSEMBLY_ACC=CAM_ASM_000847 /LENGTH=149 /DNA_ID=CAMNT_0014331187 /DNA_START=247 /DNA_END=694 /DNA_ORIENTATION=-